MEFSVLLEKLDDCGFRASCTHPWNVTVDGPTREIALARLRSSLSERLKNGVEVVRLHIDVETPQQPIWPDDEFTQAWLEGIAEARVAANNRPEPWDPNP